LTPGYLERAVTTLRSTGAANVGGRQVPVGSTPFERDVAAATTSWVGTGGAGYRSGGKPGPTDTVFLGVYDRTALASIDGYDESLLANEDYELNIRLRDAGHTVWFDPELAIEYRPRSTPRALASQYANYGRWKSEVLRRHPGSIRLRQFAPPVVIAGVAIATIIGVRRPAALALPGAYVLGLLAATRGRWRVARAAAIIHASWAAGLVRGLFSRGSSGSDR
ncbi:MAG: glycosyltransferase family 2 protein, partial [Actinomycetota bacterium]